MQASLRVSISFLFIGLIWINCGDQALLLLADDLTNRQITNLQTLKGCLFIMGAAVFLYLSSHKHSSNVWKTTKGFRRLFEDGPNPMLIFDEETLQILDVNKAAIRQYGYSREEFLQLQLEDLRPADQVSQLYNYLASLPPDHAEIPAVQHRKKNEKLFYTHIQATPTLFNGRKARLVQALDINEKVLSEKRRQQAIDELANFRYAVSQASIICTADTSGYILSANRNLCRLSRYSEEELIGKPYHALFPDHPLSLGFLKSQHKLRSGKDWKGEFRCRAKDGRTYWLAANIIPVPGDNNEISYFLSISHDITEKKRSEEKVKEAFLRYDTLAKATYDTVWEWDLHDNSLSRSDLNPEDQSAIKQRSKSTLNWWAKRVHADDYQRVVNGLQSTIQERGSLWEEEYRLLSDNKEYRYVLDRGFVIYNEEQKPVRVIGAMQDIHRLKESQKEIRKLSLVAEKTQNAVIITDKNGYIEWVNDGFTHLCGYTAEEVKGRKPGSFLQGPLTDQQTVEYIRTNLQEHNEFTTELINYRKDGSPYWGRIAISPIFDENGKLTQYISVEADVTERKRFIEKLERQNKQLKNIAWISSHEVRRPVSSILGLISLYDYECPAAPFNKEILQHLNTVTRELDVVIHRIVDKTYELEEEEK